LVKGGDGLYLCDESGKLSERLLENVGSVAWLPDSQRIVLCRAVLVDGWDQVTPVLSPAQQEELQARAPNLRRDILTYRGDWKEFKSKSLDGLTGGESAALLVLVRDQHPDELAEKLGEKWEELRKLRPAVHLLQLGTVRDGRSLELGAVLARSVDPFEELRVSPSGRLVAYGGPAAGSDPTRPLWVLPLDGSAPARLVAERTAMFSDWSADNRYLVYATTKTAASSEDDLRLGVVARRRVCEPDGTLLATMPEPEELAGVVFHNQMRVRCLQDGRILFASLEVELPCAANDMPQNAGLFALDPARLPGITRMVPRQAAQELPDATFLFEPSPDQQHVAIPGGDGRIAVLDLASGEVWELVSESEVDHLRTQPAWRRADELCFAVVPGPRTAKGRPEIVLAKLDWKTRNAQRRILSQDWPQEATVGFLTEEQAQTRPVGDDRP